MPHFKDTSGKLHFLDDAKDAHFLPAGCVEITGAEADQLRAPTAAQIAAAAVDAARAELVAIDLASIRALREYVASKADAPQFIKDREAAAVAARARLVP